MALLHCRDCGAEIDSDSRQTRCKQCGALFPFACVACGRSLRPPFPVYADERYLTHENEPLCSDHFLRQCPDCNKWFRADENPGFFRCLACTEEHKNLPVPEWNEPVIDTPPPKRAAREPRARSSQSAQDKVSIASWILMALALSVLLWQIAKMLY
jgi:hypothetical protein